MHSRFCFHKITFLLLIILISTQVIHAQDYWQQEVNYTINAKLIPSEKKLIGEETIEYKNNSPDKLNGIYIHLWPNAYKNVNTAFAKHQIGNNNFSFFYSKDEEKGFIDSINFSDENGVLEWQLLKDSIDIAYLKFRKPLNTSESIKIFTPFVLQFPASFSRLGTEKGSFQATQWYPKPAVYDATGWHYMPYLDQGEFYSEYGNFNVNITLPSNYLIAGSGDLIQKQDSVFLKEACGLNKIETQQLLKNTFPNAEKTVAFSAKKVHDFAWFADTNFVINCSQVELPNKNTVNTYSFAPEDNKKWKKATQYIDSAIYFYSANVGNYPYKQCTAVLSALKAGGGMEYPMITVIGETSSASELETVIVHEVGHNWFYGILGSNERDNGWMDEGLNTFYENRYTFAKEPEPKRKSNLPSGLAKHVSLMGFLGNQLGMATATDQALTLPAYEFTNNNYGIVLYQKTGLYFKYLEEYLGTDVFNTCMQQYYNQWKFKHPQPKNIKDVFQENSHFLLSWFFDTLLNQKTAIDFKVKKVKFGEEKTTFNVKTTFKHIPILVTYENKNSESKQAFFYLDDTKNNFTLFEKGIRKISLNSPQFIPETSINNNQAVNRLLLQKWENIKLKPIFGFESISKREVYFMPLMAYNTTDKFMLGVGFYNHFLPVKKTEWEIAPLYSFASKNLNGLASIKKTFLLNASVFDKISAGITLNSFSNYQIFSHYGNYYKFTPTVKFHFKKPSLRDTKESSITFNYHAITQKIPSSNADSILVNTTTFKQNYFQVVYEVKNADAFTPWKLNTDIQIAKSQVRASADFTLFISYDKPGKGLEIRTFAGAFLNSGTRIGANDLRLFAYRGPDNYLFNDLYFDRAGAKTNMASQVVIHDGGLRIALPNLSSPLGKNNKWLTSINLTSSLPFKVPIKPYFDFGTWANAGNDGLYKDKFAYVGGFELSIVPKIFYINFPVIKSKDLKFQVESIYNSYLESVTFVLNLNELNPFKLIQSRRFF